MRWFRDTPVSQEVRAGYSKTYLNLLKFSVSSHILPSLVSKRCGKTSISVLCLDSVSEHKQLQEKREDACGFGHVNRRIGGPQEE